MNLTDLRTLGRSGLPLSPLTLGTMTMGNTEWGSPDEESRKIFSAYVDAGGNSIDTADVYAGGRSEELVGRFLAERNLRDHVVLATKSGFSADGSNPLSGGASRKNIHRGLEGSLRRLGTDHIDLYWLHVWDRVTPAEEILSTFVDLVRSGKIRYYGFSDVPAWLAVRAATLAEAHGVPGPIAMQLEYSLVERAIEREHVPAAQQLGLGIVPWSPLAGGLLTGKYSRADIEAGRAGTGEGRLNQNNPFGQSKFADHNWRVLEVVQAVAGELDRPPSQVALAWLTQRPGVRTVLLGTRTIDQLTDNLASLEVELTADMISRLDAVSAIEPGFPYAIFTDDILRNAVSGGVVVQGWR